MTNFRMDQPISSNLLLAGLSLNDINLIQPFWVRHEIRPGVLLQKRNTPIKRAHFVETGLIATMANVPSGACSGIGLIGRGAMTGAAIVTGVDKVPFDDLVLISGTTLSIDSADLKAAMDASCSLKDRLLCFVHANSLMITQLGIAKSHGNMKTRLSCLLLTAHDSMREDDLPLTHAMIGSLLGVRRASVTIALHELEEDQLIHSIRGCVIVRDRQGLQRLAGRYYGSAEAEYERLLQTTLAKPAIRKFTPRDVPNVLNDGHA